MALETVRLSAIVGIGGPFARGGTPDPRRGSGPGMVGPYRLLDRLGSGAYAVVYRARHELIGIERAVKLLRPPIASRAHQRDQLLREARVAARLRHRNVVAVHDCGIASDGTPYIVMEYVAGPSLAERLRRGVPAPAETLGVAEQLAAALDHAHGLAVVHRDVKPGNVLLGDDGVVRLGDFGIAQAGAEPERGEPATGLGTPAYMAPEQCLGQRCGARTDVYGLAAVLYEMLTGRPPHGEGGAASSGLPDRAPPARAVNPYLPAAVDVVLAGALARDPGRRPASAGRLVAALAGALGVVPVPVRRRPRRPAVLLGAWRR
jgi:serine/threonine protein kinase